MPAPIALQLYTVREAMNEDFTGTVKRVADMGYAGVETAGFPGTTPKDAAKLFADLGMAVAGAHSPLPLGDDKNKVLDTIGDLGTTRVICPALMRDKFDTVNGVKEVCDKLNEAAEVCAENGLSLGYHNHFWEFTDLGDQNASQVFAQHLDSSIFFELDTYWAQVAGHDPVELINNLGARVPFLHIKDGPVTIEGDMVAAGEGVMDIPAIIEAGQEHTEWLIIELDRCGTDMMTAVEKSYQYLVGEGLARGNR